MKRINFDEVKINDIVALNNCIPQAVIRKYDDSRIIVLKTMNGDGMEETLTRKEFNGLEYNLLKAKYHDQSCKNS